MKNIVINSENGIKFINNQSIDEITNKLTNNSEKQLIKSILEKSNLEQDIIFELKKMKENITPTSILLYIKIIGNFNLIDAYPIFDEVMS